MLEKNVALIQACFPEVYFTCHSRHAGFAGNHGLTPRDGSLLAHIAGLDAGGHLSLLAAMLALAVFFAPWATTAALRVALE